MTLVCCQPCPQDYFFGQVNCLLQEEHSVQLPQTCNSDFAEAHQLSMQDGELPVSSPTPPLMYSNLIKHAPWCIALVTISYAAGLGPGKWLSISNLLCQLLS
jgi:hypothetical protein